MSRVFFFLTLAMLFVAGMVAGGTVGPGVAYAQTTSSYCEEDECDRAPWWKFWRSDECVMNAGYQTGCDWIGGGDCVTYACAPVTPPPPGGGGDDDDQ